VSVHASPATELWRDEIARGVAVVVPSDSRSVAPSANVMVDAAGARPKQTAGGNRARHRADRLESGRAAGGEARGCMLLDPTCRFRSSLAEGGRSDPPPRWCTPRLSDPDDAAASRVSVSLSGQESGAALDPRIVDILRQCYVEGFRASGRSTGTITAAITAKKACGRTTVPLSRATLPDRRTRTCIGRALHNVSPPRERKQARVELTIDFAVADD